MIVVSGQQVGVVFTSQNADGVSTNATGDPVGTLYVQGAADLADVVVSNISTGLYQALFEIPPLQPDYTQLELVISATVAGVAAKAKVWTGTVLRVVQQTVVGRFDDEEADSPNVTWKVGETSKPKSVTCLDASGAAIDLTAFGEFYMAIERP